MPIPITDATGDTLVYTQKAEPTVGELKRWVASQTAHAAHLLDVYRVHGDADAPLMDDESIAPDTELAFLVDYTRDHCSSALFSCVACRATCTLRFFGSVTTTRKWTANCRFVSGGWPCVGQSNDAGETGTSLYPQNGTLSISSACTCTQSFTVRSVDFTAIPTRVHIKYGSTAAHTEFKGMVENMQMRPKLSTEPSFMNPRAFTTVPGTGKNTHAMRMLRGGTFTHDTRNEPITLIEDMSFDPFRCYPIFGTANDTKHIPYGIFIAHTHPSEWMRPSIGPWCFNLGRHTYGPFVDKMEAAFAWKVALLWYKRTGYNEPHQRYPESHCPFDERLRRATDSATYRTFEHNLDANLCDDNTNPVTRMFVPLSGDAIDVAERVCMSARARLMDIVLACGALLEIEHTLATHPTLLRKHRKELHLAIREQYTEHTGHVLSEYTPSPLNDEDRVFTSIRNLQRTRGMGARADTCTYLPVDIDGLYVHTHPRPTTMLYIATHWLLYGAEHDGIGEQATLLDASPVTTNALRDGLCPTSREHYEDTLRTCHDLPGTLHPFRMYYALRTVLGRDRTQYWVYRIRNGVFPTAGTLHGAKRMRVAGS